MVKHAERRYSGLDRCLMHLQGVLGACAGEHGPAGRDYPAEGLAEPVLTEAERGHSAALLRVDHSGEVCAKGLYEGQAAGAKTASVVAHMQQAAEEEADHLAWCERRLSDLSSHTSYLNPVWYVGSFLLGYVAATCGDRWSLGFVMETEHQVEGHLQGHLAQLPVQDGPSRVVLQTMITDEVAHAEQAQQGGGEPLPDPVPTLMRYTAKIMTNLSYWM